MRVIDETGNRYGHLTVIRRDDSSHTGTWAVWLCRCDCGRERLVPGAKLRDGSVTRCRECGPTKRMEIRPGATFGNKFVIRRTYKGPKGDKSRYEVRCNTCGAVYEITGAGLRNPVAWCRQCYGKSLIKDEEGKRYGMLTVVRKVPAPPYYGEQHKQYYECRCDCGQTIIRTGMDLRNGKAFSCGCTIRTKKWRREHQDDGCKDGAADVLSAATVADGGTKRP